MKRNRLAWTALVVAVLVTAAGLNGLAQDQAGRWRSFSGLINDYTPSAAVVPGGPYEMRGTWSLDVDAHRGTASFSTVMNMETSDYGIVQGTVDKDDPTTRGAHTHHITMTDGIVSDDWAASCPAIKPVAIVGFVVKGTAFVAGSGAPAPFGNPTPVTVCVLGGPAVTFANMTLTFGMPAAKHFGTLPIHGVVSGCSGPSGHASSDCAVRE